MSEVATPRPSIASIMHDIMSPSVGTVGDDVSSLDSHLRFFFPSAHNLSLIANFSL